MLIEQVGDQPILAMLIKQVGDRPAVLIEQVVSRATIACSVEYFREVVAKYFRHSDENASLKPPWLGEERVRDFIDFNCNRT